MGEVDKFKFVSLKNKLPIELRRPELDIVREMGYEWDDPWDIVATFEKKVADFAGCSHAISVDCCSHGLFLALKYVKDYLGTQQKVVTIPKRTYISVPMQIKHAGFDVEFEDLAWEGVYQLKPFSIWDGAIRWTKDMFVTKDDSVKTIQVVSFQFKKRVAIGKGGMILTNDEKAAEILRLMRYDGRDMSLPFDHPEHIKCMGYHMYMTPEDAARGIMIMDSLSEENPDVCEYTAYLDTEETMNKIG